MKQKYVSHMAYLVGFLLIDSTVSVAFAAHMNLPGDFSPAIAIASFVFGGIIAALVGWLFWRSRDSQFEKAVVENEVSPERAYKRYCGQASKTLGIVVSTFCFIGIFFMSYIILGS
jgi:hypothetical protein